MQIAEHKTRPPYPPKPKSVPLTALVRKPRGVLVFCMVLVGLTMNYCTLANAKPSFEVLAYLNEADRDGSDRLANVRTRAERGNADAQHELGALLATGRGTATNYVEAAHWLRQAATAGHDDAQFWLGNLYKRGAGLPQDYERMAKWWRKSARQGNVSAQYALAIAYRDGSMVKQDLAQSRRWFFMASGKTGVAESQSVYTKKRYVRRMTKAEAAKARRDAALARRFASKYGEEGQAGR